MLYEAPIQLITARAVKCYNYKGFAVNHYWQPALEWTISMHVYIHCAVYQKPMTTHQWMSNTEETTRPVRVLLLEELKEKVPYTITIRAYTSVGFGPYNTSSTTDEDGKSCNCLENASFDMLLPLSFVVPIAAPDNLAVENISANELNISWERPTKIDINGELRSYTI